MERMLSAWWGVAGFQSKKKLWILKLESCYYSLPLQNERDNIEHFYEVKCYVSCRLGPERYTWLKETVAKIAELQRGTIVCVFL